MFPIPNPRNRDTSDQQRDEEKRNRSPGSFFFSQGKNIVLSAKYFSDDRLIESARGGVASKHRHRMQMALFGQLMAAFEFFLKDFVTYVIDSTQILDEKLIKEDWLKIDVERILANRSRMASVGSTLVHSTLGWHSPQMVNQRYYKLFGRRVFSNQQVEQLEQLWILRHSVAHNAGTVIHYDAMRLGNEMLANKVMDIDAEFIESTFSFLSPIAKEICIRCGEKLLEQCFIGLKQRGPMFVTDSKFYHKLKTLSVYVESRNKEISLPSLTDYEADFNRFAT